jgi:hypothetical protein
MLNEENKNVLKIVEGLFNSSVDEAIEKTRKGEKISSSDLKHRKATILGVINGALNSLHQELDSISLELESLNEESNSGKFNFNSNGHKNITEALALLEKVREKIKPIAENGQIKDKYSPEENPVWPLPTEISLKETKKFLKCLHVMGIISEQDFDTFILAYFPLGNHPKVSFVRTNVDRRYRKDIIRLFHKYYEKYKESYGSRFRMELVQIICDAFSCFQKARFDIKLIYHKFDKHKSELMDKCIQENESKK